ncbi:phosphopantetheine-binding protein [Streptomyces canus]|uniref:phosphopantetheine-binding protein n=1 Tax=Streptomyces canus TaxID=58343 RepID=UPI0030E191CE
MWPETFEQLLREVLPRLPADAALHAESNLYDLGLESLGAVAVMTKVEDLFGVELDPRLDDPQLFSTAGYLWKTVRELGSDRSF